MTRWEELDRKPTTKLMRMVRQRLGRSASSRIEALFLLAGLEEVPKEQQPQPKEAATCTQ